MDITPFFELRSRLYSSAAAGCGIIAEDFRLKRAIEAFKPLSEANKAYARLCALCEKLLTSETPAAALADCIALCDALAVTGGGYSDGTPASRAPALDTKPAQLPLSTISDFTGGVKKHPDSLTDLPKEKSGILKDPRVLRALLDIVEENPGGDGFERGMKYVCDLYGKAFVPLLKSEIASSGGQIKYVRYLAGEEENDWYLSLAENEDNPVGVRANAVLALSCSEKNADKLVELYQTEKGSLKKADAICGNSADAGRVKSAALFALARLGAPYGEEIWEKLISGKYREVYLGYFKETDSPAVTAFVKKSIMDSIEAVRKEKAKMADQVAANRALADFSAMLVGKPDTDEQYMALRGFESSEESCGRLMAGLTTRHADEIRAQIARLYGSDSGRFFRAKLYSDYMDDPKMRLPIKEHTADAHALMAQIRYIPLLGGYYITRLNLRVSDTYPENAAECVLYAEKLCGDILAEVKKKTSLVGKVANALIKPDDRSAADAYKAQMQLPEYAMLELKWVLGCCPNEERGQLLTRFSGSIKMAARCSDAAAMSIIKDYGIKLTDEEYIQIVCDSAVIGLVCTTGYGYWVTFPPDIAASDELAAAAGKELLKRLDGLRGAAHAERLKRYTDYVKNRLKSIGVEV